LKIRTKISIISILLIFTVGYLPTPVGALEISVIPRHPLTVAPVIDSDESEQSSVLRELTIDNLISLQVVQQPLGNINFVTPLPNYVTEYQTASNYGTIGLLAHNYLAGQYFFQILPGQEIELVYSDNRMDRFVVTQIQQYQALSPNSPSSDFINLDTGKYITASKLFRKIYISKTDRLVLQTCIYADQNPAWGRLFIIAEPVKQFPVNENLH
jgi:hypothetical protein